MRDRLPARRQSLPGTNPGSERAAAGGRRGGVGPLGMLQPLVARGAASQVPGQPVEERPGHTAMGEGGQLAIGRTGTLEDDFLRVMPARKVASDHMGGICLCLKAKLPTNLAAG